MAKENFHEDLFGISGADCPKCGSFNLVQFLSSGSTLVSSCEDPASSSASKAPWRRSDVPLRYEDNALLSMGEEANTRMQTSKNRLLTSLAAPDFALLARHLTPVALERGEVLQEQGAPVNWVHFPLSGAVSLLAVMHSGEAVETAIVGREGAIGLFAGFGPRKAGNRAIVQAPGTAASIPAALFQSAASQSDSIRHMILRYGEILLSQTRQSVACNALHPVEERVTRWLLQMSDRIDSSELLVTHDTLSQMLGVRRTTVTTIARKLQDDSLIRYSRGRLQITDRAALRSRACECYDAWRHADDHR